MRLHVSRLGVRALALGMVGTALAAGCQKSPAPEPSPPASSPPPPPAGPTAAGAPKNAARPMPERLVAIGDLHGDLEAARRALRLAGAIDAKDAWIGGKLVVVQTGDEIDRGDDDRAVLDLFERLKEEAPKAGGEVIALVGNHEIMNAMFDFRYVTPGSYGAFADQTASTGRIKEAIASVEPSAKPRAAAFAPGGRYAAMLAKRPAIARVGDTIFVHGGVLPKHVSAGLDDINAKAKEWLLGTAPEGPPPRALTSEDGPLWTRMYSAAPGREECAMLGETLAALGAKRMVMGHTPQRNGANAACEGKAWRIDVGMAKAFESNRIEVLELTGDAAKVLAETRDAAPDAGARPVDPPRTR
ncbi:MAG: metallophosphoesterase [Deltaproteobacteria bacterium]|nr:metallophosphoesterase [Deltaproteobacteria bacterium]